MHEMGIVLHLAKTLDELAEEQHITKIGSVTLEIGEVSGIMTDLFTDCWDYFKSRHPVLSDSELRLETIPAVTYCAGCSGTYETLRYGKECPYCHSAETWLVQGDQCIIKEIEAETEEDEAEAEDETASEAETESDAEITSEVETDAETASDSETASEAESASAPEDES